MEMSLKEMPRALNAPQKGVICRFIQSFAICFAAQPTCIFVAPIVLGDEAKAIGLIYTPFFGLSESLVRLSVGGREGSLTYYTVANLLVGIAAYSILAGFLSVFLVRMLNRVYHH
jgi:hypothetical protein